MHKSTRRIAIWAASIAALAAIPPALMILHSSYCDMDIRIRQNILHQIHKIDRHWMPICNDAIDGEYIENDHDHDNH